LPHLILRFDSGFGARLAGSPVATMKTEKHSSRQGETYDVAILAEEMRPT